MPREHLKQSIDDLLGGSLGLNVFPRWIAWMWASGKPSAFQNNPYLAGLRISLIYALVFCGGPWLFHFAFQAYFPSWSLFILQIYGSFWAGWATTSTRIASSSISKIIDNKIIPALSDATAKMIDDEIARDFKTGRLLCVSWSIAFVGAALAGFLICHDLSKPQIYEAAPPISEIIWWSLGWALLFATAAKVVSVSRFYRLFAAHLQDDTEKLYAVDSARSSLVISVAAVAQRMLLFWFGIAVSIALVVPFGVKNWSLDPIECSTTLQCFRSISVYLFALIPSQNSFVFFEVLITGFFSIGFGTVIFLRSEAAIREAVNKTTCSTLSAIEFEVADLSSRIGGLDEAKWKRLTELHSLHREVAMAGSYRSAIVSGISVMVPFVVPIIPLFLSK
jgi:hypothetical protein